MVVILQPFGISTVSTGVPFVTLSMGVSIQKMARPTMAPHWARYSHGIMNPLGQLLPQAKEFKTQKFWK